MRKLGSEAHFSEIITQKESLEKGLCAETISLRNCTKTPKST